MTNIALSPARTSAWRTHLAALGLAVAALLVFFAPDVGDLVHIWWTSTTFGHCLFILPVVAWLVWTRREGLAQLAPVAWWPGLLLVAAGGFGWLLGDAASVALARQLGLVLMVQGAAVTLLGPNVARALLFPLAYLIFAVPFGEELEAPLQSVTVAMVMPMLHLAGIPASVDGVLIHAGPYWFEVAEACSGAKFVIAMLAFGTLVAGTCFASWTRRAVFMVAALVIPVLANAVRAWGTIYAANLVGVERATGFDHIVYGWVFFGVVMALVLAAGWRWFDRAPDDAVFDAAALQSPPRHATGLGAATLLVLATALLFPAWSAAVAGRTAPLPAQVALPEVPGWRRAPLDGDAPWSPHYPAADHFLLGRYVDASGDAIDLSVAVFARQREGAELIAFGTGVLREADRWIRVADQPALAGGSAMRITTTGRAGGVVERVVATWYRVGGVTTASPLRVKLATTEARLLGGDQTAVAVHVSTVVRPGRNPRAAIARFVAAAGPIDRMADRVLLR
jgi:exosortase A